jgi:hypothetical protein
VHGPFYISHAAKGGAPDQAPPSKGLVVELYLIYFGLAQSFVDDSSIDVAN